MNIRDTRALKNTAAQRLDTARDAKKIVLIYAGITILLTVLVTVVNYVTNLQMAQSGGLRNLGIRSILSTVQTILPFVQTAVLMCLGLGYQAAMLRISRGQYTSPQTLRIGIDRFWPLLRCTMLQAVIYFAAGVVSFYLAMQIYLITPLSNDFMALLMPLLSSTEAELIALLGDEAFMLQVSDAMIPMLVLVLVIFAALAFFLSYQFRMANYVLIDNPRAGGLMALRESRRMTKGNRLALFRLDLSMWWYYGLTLLAAIVGYGDQLLAYWGLQLPWPAEVTYFICFALFLIIEFAIYYFTLNRVETTYALAYESLRPKEKDTNGVVLGNIFDM